MSLQDDINWMYDEFRQVGTDYGSQEEVDVYEARHSDFRDLEGEADALLDTLGIGADHTVMDVGSGPGIFAIQAARRCRMVYGVDVSQAMIRHAEAKARQAGVGNVAFRHGGFLSYEHAEEPVDFITTTYALHHLPDFWKAVALERLHGMLRDGGVLYINDVILVQDGMMENISAFIEHLSASGDDFTREDVEKHFREEFSTFDWVMDELLTRAGFTIRDKEMKDGVIGLYTCTPSR